MKLLLKIGIILCTGMMVQNAQGQSHNTNCPQCVYSKNRVKDPTKIGTADESCGCTACGEKKKKEKTAKQAEKKKREDLLASKHKAEKEAKQKAFLAEQKRKQEEASKPKSGEVVINAQPTSTTQSVQPKSEIKLANGMKKGKLYSGKGSDYLGKRDTNDYFILDSKKILQGQFAACLSIAPDDAKADNHFPENIGIVILNEKKSISWTNNYYNKEVISEYPICDLVNSEGKRLLNDDAITYIFHFYGDWFVLVKGKFEIGNYGSPDAAEFYNIKTKESHQLVTTTFDQFAGRLVTCVKDLSCVVQYETPASYSDFFRTTGTFKASLNSSAAVYYLTNDDTIEFDRKGNQ